MSFESHCIFQGTLFCYSVAPFIALVYSAPPGQNNRHFPDNIFKCIFMNKNGFGFGLHWRLFLRVQLTIFQHWFRKWLGANQATSHYLNQCWLKHICGSRGRWVNYILVCLQLHTSQGCFYPQTFFENTWSKLCCSVCVIEWRILVLYHLNIYWL